MRGAKKMILKLVGNKAIWISGIEKEVQLDELFEVEESIGISLLAQGNKFVQVQEESGGK